MYVCVYLRTYVRTYVHYSIYHVRIRHKQTNTLCTNQVPPAKLVLLLTKLVRIVFTPSDGLSRSWQLLRPLGQALTSSGSCDFRWVLSAKGQRRFYGCLRCRERPTLLLTWLELIRRGLRSDALTSRAFVRSLHDARTRLEEKTFSGRSE